MKILIATGGSGGHIFPALVTAKELKARKHTVVFAGALGRNGVKITEAGFQFFEIDSKGFSNKSLKTILSFISAQMTSLSQSFQALKKLKPDVVIGYGGYGAFPVVLAAVLRGYPTMIHEQNVVPGKANKVLSSLVKRIAVSFSDAVKNFPANKTVFTGGPCRPLKTEIDRNAILQQFGLQSGRSTILVLGGSQGSHRINTEFLSIIPDLKNKVFCQVVHLTGEKDFAECKAKYAGLGIPTCVLSFSDDIEKIYGITDVVISRAGAMTVTELAAYALPSILIPYPYAGGHQSANAAVLAQRKGSRLIEEKDLTPEILQEGILKMLSEKMSKEELSRSYEGIYHPDAGVKLADEVEKLKK